MDETDREGSVLDLIATEVQEGGLSMMEEEEDMDSLGGDSVEDHGGDGGLDGLGEERGKEEPEGEEEEDEDDALGDLYAGLEDTEEEVTESHRDLVKKLLRWEGPVDEPRRITPRDHETTTLEQLYNRVVQAARGRQHV